MEAVTTHRKLIDIKPSVFEALSQRKARVFPSNGTLKRCWRMPVLPANRNIAPVSVGLLGRHCPKGRICLRLTMTVSNIFFPNEAVS